MPAVTIIDPAPEAKPFALPVRYRPPSDDLDEVFKRPLNHRLEQPKPDETPER